MWTTALALTLGSAGARCRAQQYSGGQRWLAQQMLRDAVQDVKQHYYDPLALGSAWEARVEDTREKIDKAGSINEALSHLAALLDSLNDSHTYLLPPPRPYRHDYGFQMEILGERCYVTRVRAGSDAQSKGLKPGDEILSLDGYALSRTDISRVRDLFWKFQPQLQLRLEVRGPEGARRQVEVSATIRQISPPDPRDGGPPSLRVTQEAADPIRPAYSERGRGLLIVKLPSLDLSNAELAVLAHRMRNHAAVILDLRGNPGGSRETLKRLVGSVLPAKVKIGELVNSRSSTWMESEPRREVFTGELAVLIDSESSSAAELFARVMQIERRGLVFGDRSAGRVMAAEQYMHQAGLQRVIVYGTAVTEAEIRMSDGQTLEHNGVLPDREMLPTPADLAAGRDPVLAAAAQALEVKMTPEEAGAALPFQREQ